MSHYEMSDSCEKKWWILILAGSSKATVIYGSSSSPRNGFLEKWAIASQTSMASAQGATTLRAAGCFTAIAWLAAHWKLSKEKNTIEY